MNLPLTPAELLERARASKPKLAPGGLRRYIGAIRILRDDKFFTFQEIAERLSEDLRVPITRAQVAYVVSKYGRAGK